MRDTLADVGRALHTWSLVEDAIQGIFRSCFFPGDQLPAVMAFNTVQNIRVRLTMVSNVLPTIAIGNNQDEVEDEFVPMWNKLKDKVEDQYRKRAKLSHFSLTRFPNRDGTTRVEIVPFLSAYPKRTGTQIIPMPPNEIKDCVQRWEKLQESLKWFLSKVQEHQGQPPESSVPPNDLIREIQAQVQLSRNPKEPEPRPLPFRVLSQFGAWLTETFS